MSALLKVIDDYNVTIVDNYTGTATTISVSAAPTVITSGYLTIFDLNGDQLEKIKFTGVSGTDLTGCLRGLSFTTNSDSEITANQKELKNGMVAKLSVSQNYHNNQADVLNGTTPSGGVMKNPSARTISDPRHLVDKEYADAISTSGLTTLAVTDAGGLDVNVNSGWYSMNAVITFFSGASGETLTDDTTNYVELDSSGAINISTSAFDNDAIPLAKVTTVAGDITVLEDARSLSVSDLTKAEKDALDGTSGTPSSSNEYVTENDTSNGATITDTTIALVTGTPATITDSGDGFVTAGFRAGQTITISGSTADDGNYTLATVAIGTLTLATGETLTGEVAGDSITISAVLANKVARLNASGNADDLIGNPTVKQSLTAGEDITLSGVVPKTVFIEKSGFTNSNRITQDDSSNSNEIYGQNYYAQSFTATDFNRLTTVELYIAEVSAPSGLFHVDLYEADGDDNPTGSILATDSVSATTIGGAAYNSFTLTYSLTLGQKYVFVARCPDGDASNRIIWNYSTLTDPYTGGRKRISTDAGLTWQTGNLQDFRFKVNGGWEGTTGKIYETDSGETDKNYAHGYILNSVTEGNNTDVIFAGRIENFSGLTVGEVGSLTFGEYLNATSSIKIIK